MRVSRPTRPRRVSPAWCALALVAGLALPVGPAHAQESFFSLQFLGVREETSDARARAMGVLGVGLEDPKTAATLNPANFGLLERMTLSVVAGASVHTARDGTLEDQRSDATFPHIRAALPLPGRLVFSIGFVGLRNYRSEFVLPRQSVGPYTYHDNFDRSGSLYQVPLGLSRSITSRVHVGATVDFILGTVDEAWTVNSDSLLALRTRRRDGMNGTSVTLGALVDPLEWLRLGVAWSPSATLDVETRTTIEDGRIAGTPLRDDRTLSSARYPATFRGGASAQWGKKLVLTGDYLYRDWKDWDGRLYGAEAATAESRVGGGLEIYPHRSPRWRRFGYRVGVSHETWPYKLGGADITQTTVHFGSGFELRGGAGRLDVAIERSWIGDLAINGYEESRWAFVFSVSGQETWRRKSPRK